MRAAPLISGTTWALALTLTPAIAASAQRSALREVRDWGLAGASFALVLPRDRSAAPNVRIGGGVTGYMTVYIDRAGFFGVRIDGSILGNGHSNRVAYAQGPYSYPIDMTVISFIGGLRAGPQITLGLGALQLYGFGTAGLTYVATTTTYDDHGCRCYDDSYTDWGDYHWSSEVGAGMLLRLGGPRGKVNLDLGVRRLGKAFTQYWTSGSGDDSTGPQPTELELMALHMGVTVGLR